MKGEGTWEYFRGKIIFVMLGNPTSVSTETALKSRRDNSVVG